jgi:hypothetical protein
LPPRSCHCPPLARASAPQTWQTSGGRA